MHSVCIQKSRNRNFVTNGKMFFQLKKTPEFVTKKKTWEDRMASTAHISLLFEANKMKRRKLFFNCWI